MTSVVEKLKPNLWLKLDDVNTANGAQALNSGFGGYDGRPWNYRQNVTPAEEVPLKSLRAVQLENVGAKTSVLSQYAGATFNLSQSPAVFGAVFNGQLVMSWIRPSGNNGIVGAFFVAPGTLALTEIGTNDDVEGVCAPGDGFLYVAHRGVARIGAAVTAPTIKKYSSALVESVVAQPAGSHMPWYGNYGLHETGRGEGVLYVRRSMGNANNEWVTLTQADFTTHRLTLWKEDGIPAGITYTGVGISMQEFGGSTFFGGYNVDTEHIPLWRVPSTGGVSVAGAQWEGDDPAIDGVWNGAPPVAKTPVGPVAVRRTRDGGRLYAWGMASTAPVQDRMHVAYKDSAAGAWTSLAIPYTNPNSFIHYVTPQTDDGYVYLVVQEGFETQPDFMTLKVLRLDESGNTVEISTFPTKAAMFPGATVTIMMLVSAIAEHDADGNLRAIGFFVWGKTGSSGFGQNGRTHLHVVDLPIPAVVSTVGVNHATKNGCNMAGATQPDGAAFICMWMTYNDINEDFPMLSSESGNRVTLVRHVQGPLYVDCPDDPANSPPFDYTLDVEVDTPTMAGWFHWKTGGVHHFQGVLNGQRDGVVHTYAGSLNVNLSLLGGWPSPAAIYSRRTRVDEVMFWKAGNSLTDADLLDLYNSYAGNYEIKVDPIDDDFFGVALVQAVEPEASCATLDSTCWCTEFASPLIGCPPLESPAWPTNFDSWEQPEFVSKMPCAAPVSLRIATGGFTVLGVYMEVEASVQFDLPEIVTPIAVTMDAAVTLPPLGDPLWPRVLSLVKFDGPENSTALIDLTGRHTAAFPAAGQKIQSAIAQWDQAWERANLLNGMVALTGNPSDFGHGVGDFCYEGWNRWSSVSFMASSGEVFRGAQTSDGAHMGLRLWFEGASPTSAYFRFFNSTPFAFDVSSEFPTADGMWMWWVWQRQNGVMSLWCNGTRVYNAVNNWNVITPQELRLLWGAVNGAGSSYMDDWRVTGVARYPNLPTLPMPTAPWYSKLPLALVDTTVPLAVALNSTVTWTPPLLKDSYTPLAMTLNIVGSMPPPTLIDEQTPVAFLQNANVDHLIDDSIYAQAGTLTPGCSGPFITTTSPQFKFGPGARINGASYFPAIDARFNLADGGDFTLDWWGAQILNGGHIFYLGRNFVGADDGSNVMLSVSHNTGNGGQILVVPFFTGGGVAFLAGWSHPSGGTVNVFDHYAVVRRLNTLYLFKNGTLGGPVTPTGMYDLTGKVFQNPPNKILVMGGYAPSQAVGFSNGVKQLDGVRFIRKALWTSNFTPPVAAPGQYA